MRGQQEHVPERLRLFCGRVSCSHGDFYRVHHHLEVGSGLGLSIVDKATQRLGGTLQLGRSIDLGGLLVTVRLPKKLERHG